MLVPAAAAFALLHRLSHHCLPVLSPAALCSSSPTPTPSTRATRPNDQLHPRPLSHSLSLVILPPSSTSSPFDCCRSFCCLIAAPSLFSSLIVAPSSSSILHSHSTALAAAGPLEPLHSAADPLILSNRRTHSPPAEHHASGDPPPSAAVIRDTVPIVCLLACRRRLHPALSYALQPRQQRLPPLAPPLLWAGTQAQTSHHPGPSLHGA